MWEVWLPKKALCEVATGVNGERSEDASSEEYYEHNVGNLELEKLEVRGPWSGTKGDSMDPKGRGATSQIAQRLQERRRRS